MAEGLLVMPPLTDSMIQAEKDLLARIKNTDIGIVAALWLYTSETGEWRCMLALPQLSTDGPKKSYEALWAVMYSSRDRSPLHHLDFDRIAVVEPEDALVRALANAGKSLDISGRFLFNTRLDSTFIEGIYVYFVSPSVKPHEVSSTE